MKTRAKDHIQLSSGTIMSLGEAVGQGLLYMVALDRYGTPTRESSEAKRFIARERNGDLFWEIGKTYFMGFFQP